ncbi:MAG: sulfotransferase [Planctomycetota bacterium]
MVRRRKAIRSFLLDVLCTPIFLVHRIALRLDDWLYPSLHSVPITKPLFIVGLPRSGTTLLHRLIASDQTVFTTLPLWESLLAPAVCEKRFFRRIRKIDRWFGSPLWRILCAIQQTMAMTVQDVHATDLQSPEEDYLALLPFGGCFLRVISSPWNADVWKLGHFSDQLEPPRQKELISTYKRILQRHLFFRGQHLVLLSKNPSLTSWLPALAEEFPDACFVGLRRVPHQSVPSQLSSLRSGMALFGTDVAESEIVDRFVRLLASYWRVLDHANEVLPSTRFQLIAYEQLIRNSYSLASRILDQFGFSLSEQGLAKLEHHCSRQREYRSSHRYCLEEFGLDHRQLYLVFGSEAARECLDRVTVGLTSFETPDPPTSIFKAMP